MMILNYVFEKWFVMAQAGLNAEQGVVAGLHELGNEPLVSFHKKRTIC
jgi:hypothetical protein